MERYESVPPTYPRWLAQVTQEPTALYVTFTKRSRTNAISRDTASTMNVEKQEGEEAVSVSRGRGMHNLSNADLACT